jgi:AcrR family transcriptional regulator
VSDQEVLAAVRAAVIEHGASVSLDVAAEALGVTAPALFKRFGSRRALLLAALRPPEAPPWVSALRAGPDPRPLEPQLAEILSQMIEFFRELTPCLVALRMCGIPEEEIMAHFRRDPPPPVVAVRALAAWIEQAQQRGLVSAVDPQSAAMALLGAAHLQVFLEHVAHRNKRARPRAEFVENLAQAFAAGLGAPRPARRAPAPRSKKASRSRPLRRGTRSNP